MSWHTDIWDFLELFYLRYTAALVFTALNSVFFIIMGR